MAIRLPLPAETSEATCITVKTVVQLLTVVLLVKYVSLRTTLVLYY